MTVPAHISHALLLVDDLLIRKVTLSVMYWVGAITGCDKALSMEQKGRSPSARNGDRRGAVQHNRQCGCLAHLLQQITLEEINSTAYVISIVLNWGKEEVAGGPDAWIDPQLVHLSKNASEIE